ncbi:MAG: hypothetical protein GY906_16305 [bacterium]|nr:hypothetical protein [bacterium]
MRILTKCTVSLVICSFGTTAVHANGPCDLMPFDSVDNGMGAEPGVIREFASGISIPPECMQGGRTWIPRVGVNLTRTAAGSSTIELDVFVRAATSVGGPPHAFHTDPNSVNATGIPVFPSSQYYEYNASANNNQNINNVLWGDYQYIDARLNGDTTNLVFVSADQSGTPGETPCFTGINGEVPLDPCTNGNPNLNAAGLGAQGYTFYGRCTSGSQIMGREPLGMSWGARYINGSQAGATIDLYIKDGRDGPTICQYMSIPDDYEFACAMTSGEVASLDAGGVFAEEVVNGVPASTPVIPADSFIFADGFESGDVSVWSSTVP